MKLEQVSLALKLLCADFGSATNGEYWVQQVVRHEPRMRTTWVASMLWESCEPPEVHGCIDGC